jgi:hypothetical protein
VDQLINKLKGAPSGQKRKIQSQKKGNQKARPGQTNQKNHARQKRQALIEPVEYFCGIGCIISHGEGKSRVVIN